MQTPGKLAASPGYRCCCTHEYTLGNLKFATAVDRQFRLIHTGNNAEQRRSRGEPTLPSTIALEREVNPFLRTRVPAVAQAAHAYNAADERDEVAVFAALRQWKNEFR